MEEQNTTLATDINNTEAGSKKKYLYIIYYNCNQKVYYSKS